MGNTFTGEDDKKQNYQLQSNQNTESKASNEQNHDPYQFSFGTKKQKSANLQQEEFQFQRRSSEDRRYYEQIEKDEKMSEQLLQYSQQQIPQNQEDNSQSVQNEDQELRRKQYIIQSQLRKVQMKNQQTNTKSQHEVQQLVEHLLFKGKEIELKKDRIKDHFDVKNQLEQQSQQGISFQPTLCPKSVILNRLKQEDNQEEIIPAYQRLFNLTKKNQNNVTQKINVSQSCNFLDLNKTSQLGSPQTKDIGVNRLYQDAKRINDKKERKEKESQKQSEAKPHQLEKKSELVLANKITKEFQQTLDMIIEDPLKKGFLLEYTQFSDILKMMNFVSQSEKVYSINFVNERSLINDLWIILEGHINEGISARNLLVCLLSIMGLCINVPCVKGVLKNRDSKFDDQFLRGQARPLQKDEEGDLYQSQNKGIKMAGQPSSLRKSSEKVQYQNQNRKNSTQEEEFFQIQYQKQSNVQINQDMADYLDSRYRQIKLGFWDENKNITFNDLEVKEIQKHFNQFYLNKLHIRNQILNLQDEQNNNLQTLNLTNTKNSQEISRSRFTSPKRDNKTNQSQDSSHLQNSKKKDLMVQSHRKRMEEIVRYSPSKQDSQVGLTSYDLMMGQLELKNRHIQEIKTILEEDEFQDCTFHPKTLPYKGSNGVVRKEIPIEEEDIYKTNEKNNNNPMPTYSLGAQRYENLYKLAKPRRQLVEKKTDEIEYEKNCDECTFNPDLKITQLKFQKQNEKYNYVKNGDQSINRLRRAYQDKLKVDEQLSRGYQGLKHPKIPKKVMAPSNYSSQREQQQISVSPQKLRQAFGYNIDQKTKSIPLVNNQFQNDENLNVSPPQTVKGPQAYQPGKPHLNKNYDFLLNNSQNELQKKYQSHEEQSSLSKQSQQKSSYSSKPQYESQRQNEQRAGYEDYDYSQNFYPLDQRRKTTQDVIDSIKNTENDLDNLQQSEKKVFDNFAIQQENDDFNNMKSQESERSKNSVQDALLFVDVNLSAERMERIVIRQGDQVEQLADQFIRQHNLSPDIKFRLTELLQEQLSQVLGTY